MSDPKIPPHVAETVQAIALLHAEHHRKSTMAERIVDRITTSVGRPIFLLMLLGGMMLWMSLNEFISFSGGSAPDAPPYTGLELGVSLFALVIAVMILISQSRADRFANLREQMTLEATLLTEQKTRKIIQLLEELRRDSPGVRDRQDVEALQMAAKADPHEVLAVIDEVTQVHVAGAEPAPPPDRDQGSDAAIGEK